MSDAESDDLLRELSKELDSMSDFDEEDTTHVKRLPGNEVAAQSTGVYDEPTDIQRISMEHIHGATQREALVNRFPPEKCSLASSVSMSPVHSCDRLTPLSPTSTATLETVPFIEDSSCIQRGPFHASASCTSVDTDHLHHTHCSTVPSASKVCQSDLHLQHSTRATTHAACATAQQQQQHEPAQQRPGEATSESRVPQKKRPRVRNRATAHFVCDAASQRRIPARSTAPIAKLPHDILQNILQHASAADLTRAACTCKALRRAAGSEGLWRRLYCSRWGAFRGGEEKVMGASFWKRTYMVRDAADHESNASSQAEVLRGEYHSMLLTEREASVAASAEPSWNLLMGSSQEQVAAFVRARGFSGTVQRPADLRSVQLVRFGDVFVDELSGWLHVCDKACDLQAEDDTGAFMVCPLTGRMHGRVAATWDGGACGGAMEDLVDSGVGEGGTAVDMRDADGDNAPDGGYCHNEEDDGCVRKCALLALELTK